MTKTYHYVTLTKMFPRFGVPVYEILKHHQSLSLLDERMGFISNVYLELFSKGELDQNSLVELLIELKSDYDKALEYVKERIDLND